ncbi:MAG: phosphatidylinositol-3-phosphatase [Ktedonobacteraceae bacterium]
MSILGLVFILFGGLLRFFQPSGAVPTRSSMASVSPLFGIFDSTTATVTPGGSPAMTPSPSVTTVTTVTPGTTPSTTPTPSSLPHFDHIVIVIEENKGYSQIIGANSSAVYINSLAAQGMLFTNSHALTHPSEPNYLDLFSGSDQGVIGDACDSSVYAPPDLGGQLISAKYSFAGYSEGLAAAGDTSCSNSATGYVRKHAPWANFSDTNGPTTNLPYTSFPTNTAGYSSLPTVSFVVPNLKNDMHDGSIQQGDTWLQQNMDAYAQWAKTNNSLLIVTWDENDTYQADFSNQVATIFVGQHVQLGTNNTSINHFSVLRTLEDMYGLPSANSAASASAILGVWN